MCTGTDRSSERIDVRMGIDVHKYLRGWRLQFTNQPSKLLRLPVGKNEIGDIHL